MLINGGTPFIVASNQNEGPIMNIGRSTKIALASSGHTNEWLASQMGVTTSQASRIKGQKSASGLSMESLAKVFDMKVSEFIALGEVE